MTGLHTEAGLRYDVDAPVATITLCRPDTRNAQSPVMWAALRAIGVSLPPAVRVVVVRATGSSFSSGLDLRLLHQGDVDGDPSLPDLGRRDDGVLDALLASYQDAFT